MAKFLGDDTLELESNQWWEADSHLQEKNPLASNRDQSGDTHLQQTKSLWDRTSPGELALSLQYLF